MDARELRKKAIEVWNQMTGLDHWQRRGPTWQVLPHDIRHNFNQIVWIDDTGIHFRRATLENPPIDPDQVVGIYDENVLREDFLGDVFFAAGLSDRCL